MVRHGTVRKKFCSYKTEAIKVETQSNFNFCGSVRRGVTYKLGVSADFRENVFSGISALPAKPLIFLLHLPLLSTTLLGGPRL